MPRIDAIANSPPLQPPVDGGHANHGATGNAQHGGNGGSLTSSSGEPHPQHVPLSSQAQGGKKHDVQDMALGVRAYRQQLIASNIANADTPGYKAVDIDVAEAMRIARLASQAPPTTLATTGSGHISATAVSAQPPYPLKYQVPSQDSADGNTVDMDVERTKFSDNSFMYQFSVDRVSGHFKMLMELYQSLK
ncbi:flagellar basal body rod protein FlgB [Dechloromonas sp. A34]|uniref:flagellar basal body rod protein FlgB n=1 Tax=Dechloromonas sp. A34 TaxID=447588 RepID=UPI002248B018|nr:flagellar basal body rod protein FlgB [Dechloromonas sp. A34]